MKISMMATACVLAMTVFAGGCAAEQGDDEEDNEEVGTDEAAAIHTGDIARRAQAAAAGKPDLIMDSLASHAREVCRMTRDANGKLSGPYGLITMTVAVQDGTVTKVALEAPHANTAIGACIENDIRSITRLGQGKATFTRTKRFTIKAPGKG